MEPDSLMELAESKREKKKTKVKLGKKENLAHIIKGQLWG